MRIIDAVLDHDRADRLRADAEEAGHPIVELARTDAHSSLRVIVLHSDPDEFLDGLRKQLREDGTDPTDAHYVVFEPLAFEPKPDEPDENEADAEAGTDEIESFVDDGVRLSRTFLILSGLSGVLAAGGLILDNVAVVVGAMVLAPLFRPIAAVGVAAVLGRPDRMLRGAICTAASLALSAALGGLLALITPGVDVTGQIVARTGINAFDLVIALAAGSAMSVILLKRDITAMVGIVVAASLVPVAAAAGVVAALGEWRLLAGAAFTLGSNVAGILLGLVIGLRVSQVEGLTFADRRKGKLWGRRSIVVGSVLSLALAGIAIWTYTAGRSEARPSATEFASVEGVRAAWNTADGVIALVADPEVFRRPDGLPDDTVILHSTDAPANP